jgi:hypothetical protein
LFSCEKEEKRKLKNRKNGRKEKKKGRKIVEVYSDFRKE